MKFRLLFLLISTLAFSTLPAVAAEKAEPNPTVTTTKRSAIQVGSSSFALVKGTKLEVLGRDGKLLLVKYRTSQGKIPYADTDYVLPEGEETEETTAEEPPAPQAPAKPATPPTTKPAPAALPAVAKQTAGQTPGGQQPTTVPPPPALSLDQIRPATAGTDPVPTAVGNRAPATNYGKMVQKAKQAEQAHNDKLVKPSDEILGEQPKK